MGERADPSDPTVPHSDDDVLAGLLAGRPPALVRTDFRDGEAWAAVVAQARKPFLAAPQVEFMAYLRCIDDPRFENWGVSEFLNLSPRPLNVLFIVDAEAFDGPGYPILAVDMLDNPGAVFRVAATRLFEVENNVSEGNMYFSEFANGVDPDGVFWGYIPPIERLGEGT